MKTPKAFGHPCGVLNTGMTFIVLLYVAVGALGYIFCVSNCSDSITLDLPKGDPLVFYKLLLDYQIIYAVVFRVGLAPYLKIQIM